MKPGGERTIGLAFCLWLQCRASTDLQAPDNRAAAEYLSEEPFPGLHVIERVGQGPQLLLHRMGQHPKAAGREPVKVDSSSWKTWSTARDGIERLFRIPEREPLQSDWAIFTSQGRRVSDLDTLLGLTVAFVLEIGQWIWPPVRIGFEHKAESVNRTSAAILRTLSLRPVVFEVREFISKTEAKTVMEIGRQQGLHSSQGVMQSRDLKKKTKHSEFRTSKQAWLLNTLSPVIAELDERVANLTRVPASHNEAVQLLRYNEGQYYHGHMDWTELELYPDQRNVWQSSHFGHQDRLATVFWYLNDVQEGGETIFPKAGQPICSLESRGGKGTRFCKGASDPNMASCAEGLKVPPRRGSVILWYNFHANGRGDRNALHAGCPVGHNLTKWSANKWVRIKPADSQGTWIQDHPAMERHGWVGTRNSQKSSVLEAQRCTIRFANEAGVSVDLMWCHAGSCQKLTSLSVGESSSTDSYRGHAFELWAGSRKSNQVECQGMAKSFTLSTDFVISESDRDTEL